MGKKGKAGKKLSPEEKAREDALAAELAEKTELQVPWRIVYSKSTLNGP